MKPAKRQKLEKFGWTAGNAIEFLRLSPEETELIEVKLRLANQSKPRKK